MPELNVIDACDLTLAYPASAGAAVEHLSLALPGGELVIVLGPNGGGKTTLFKALTGELAPVSGTLTVRGRIATCPSTTARAWISRSRLSM